MKLFRLRRERLKQYHRIISNADYVFLASDAVTGMGIATLWTEIWKHTFENTPFFMVSPGVRSLVELPEFVMTHVNHRYYGEGTGGLPYQHENFFGEFKASLLTTRLHENKPLYEIHSPNAEVSASGLFVDHNSSEWDYTTEKIALTQAIDAKIKSKFLVIISQDKNFLLSLRERYQTDHASQRGQKSLLTLSLRDNGDLYDPFAADGDDLKNRAAAAQLFSLAESLPLYIEDGALKHPAAEAFLSNIHIPLLHHQRQLILLADKAKGYPKADIINSRAQSTPATIRFAWLEPDKNKSEALVDRLMKEAAGAPSAHIALITDRVPRAERLQLQLDGMGIQVDIYSINQFGYLSSRDKGKESILKNREKAEKKSIRAEWEVAVREEDTQKIQRLISKKEEADAGLRCCLLTGKAHIMEMILDSLPPTELFHLNSFVEWWICEFRQFQNSTYLIKNRDFYKLLVKVLTRCRMREVTFKKIEEHLDRLSEKTNREIEEIEYLNEMLSHSGDDDLPVSKVLTGRRIKSLYPLHSLPSSQTNEQWALELQQTELKKKLEDIEMQLSALEAQRMDLLAQLNTISGKLESPPDEPIISTINKAKLAEWLTRYKDSFADRWETMSYKWEAVCDFHQHWDLEAEDLKATVEQSLKQLSKNRRLLRPFGERMAYGMLHQFATHEKENTRKLFRELYNGISKENAEEHITRFLEAVTEMKERRRIHDMPNWRKHFQTKSTISALLWVHSPQQFFYAEPQWAKECFRELELPYSGSSRCFHYAETLNNLAVLVTELKKRTYALKTFLTPYIRKLELDADTAVCILVNDFAEFVGRSIRKLVTI